MAKYLRNVSEIGPLLEHSTGEGVPKQMGGDMRGARDTCLRHRLAHNVADTRGPCERHARSIRAQEDPRRGPPASIGTQIAGNPGSHIARQGQPILPTSFTADQNLTCPPAYVPQFE